MAKARYEITPTGLVAHSGWTVELWEEAGHEIGRYQKGLMWLIGDWLNAGDREGYVERGKLAEACERFGVDYHHARDAARVSEAFQSEERSSLLEWSHHRVAAGHHQAAELLAWAEETRASVKQLREEKKRRSAQKPRAVKPTEAGEAGEEAASVEGNDDIEPDRMLDEISYYALSFLNACPERAGELEDLLVTWVSRCKQR